jgi:predicted DNA-binding transcriptional regulator AlpA
MPRTEFITDVQLAPDVDVEPSHSIRTARRKPPQSVGRQGSSVDPLLTVEDVAWRLNVSKDCVWDHSSRKTPHLPVIRMGDGTLRYRASAIEAFISERERITALRSKRR